MSAAHPHLMYFKYGFNYCSVLRDSCLDPSPKLLSSVAGTWEMHGCWFNHSAGLDGAGVQCQGLHTQGGIAHLLQEWQSSNHATNPQQYFECY